MQLFCAAGTQINVAPSGAVLGFRYEALPAIWAALAFGRRRRRQSFLDLRVMERAMVDVLNNGKAGG